MSGDNTPENNLAAPWEKGQSGNPKGRPKGARNRLGESFIADLQRDWEENGADVLQRCREEKPADYVRVVASLLPKEVKITNPEKDLTDEELMDALDFFRNALLAGPDQSDDRPTHGGTDATQ